MINLKKLGLIVNPIAGMGGRVGLKGTDGKDTYRRAAELGAVPQAPDKAVVALKEMEPLKESLEIVTCSGDMGENEVAKAGFSFKVVISTYGRASSREDTIRAVKCMNDEGVDLIAFAGGDGTARDVCCAADRETVVLGIPAGVKMHSAVYAATPQKAGLLALKYLNGGINRIQEAEVMDIDEGAFRQGRVSAKLYGYLNVPYERSYLQGLKSSAEINEDFIKEAIALDVTDHMEEDVYYIIGPGSTTRPIMEKLGLQYTLLGVDLVLNKKLVGLDLSESEILKHVTGKPFKIVITPIGGQGCLFGRGNQQISPDIIRKAGRGNIIVVATKQKINSLYGTAFMVDTGDAELDSELSGYLSVITGYNDRVIYRVGNQT